MHKHFMSKLNIAVVYTMVVFSVVGVLASTSMLYISLYDVILYALLPIYSIMMLVEILSYMRSRTHVFTGQIKNSKDVDNFLYNYKCFMYADATQLHNYDHLIVNSIMIIIDGKKLKILTPGVYAWHKNNDSDFLFKMFKVYSKSEMRKFIWEERKHINLKLKLTVYSKMLNYI